MEQRFPGGWKEIASALVRLTQVKSALTLSEPPAELQQQERMLLPKVLAILKTRTDRDFTRYKKATVLRRIARRMQLNSIEDLSDYMNLLMDQRDEVRALADDLLITVTSFFRDPDAFRKLETEIVPKLFDGKTGEDSVWVWSVGCATGEEAYSLAMLFMEEAARRTDTPEFRSSPPICISALEVQDNEYDEAMSERDPVRFIN